MTSKKAVNKDQIVCDECEGSGYAFTETGVVRCRCTRSRDLEVAIRAAHVPRKFAQKTLTTFSAKNQRQKEILLGARNFVKTFSGTHSSQPAKGLLLTGKEGTGKTHVAIAILKEVIAQGHTGLYWNVPELFLELRRRMNDDSEESESDLFDHARRVDLLVLDDLGAEKTSEYVLDRLYVLINRRYEHDGSMIVTSNRSLSELRTQLTPRIASRLGEMCVVVEFPEGDFRLQNIR